MIIQATPYGSKKEEPFAFTYSGDFTDSRVDGIGDVTLNTSGQLVTSGKTVKVKVYILGAGGGGWHSLGHNHHASGGSGGYQTVEVELAPGTYEIVIGTGGAAVAYNNNNSTLKAGSGGNTTAFGITSTGGSGGYSTRGGYIGYTYGGSGGAPNGQAGTKSNTGAVAGGSPNGGASTNPGGNGLVRITFS